MAQTYPLPPDCRLFMLLPPRCHFPLTFNICLIVRSAAVRSKIEGTHCLLLFPHAYGGASPLILSAKPETAGTRC